MVCLIQKSLSTVFGRFRLEGKPPPTRRLKISLVDKGTYMGNLHPFHGIKLLGAPCCASCPAIFDGAHLPECEANKLKVADLAKLRKKRVFQAEQRAKREAEPGEWVEVRDKRALGRVQLR